MAYNYGNYNYNQNQGMQYSNGQYYQSPNSNYNPNYQMMQAPQPANNLSRINWVQGQAGANAFHLDPGESALLMDSEDSVLYSFICTASKVDDPGVIPDSWRESVRESVTKEVRSKALRGALQEWINWETETVKLYSGFYTKLISMEEIPAADFVEHYILDAEKEATFAKDELNKKMAIDFDIVSIMEEQEEFESIYKKKLRKVYKEGDLYGNS